MKKFTLLLILNLSFLIFNSQKAKAQWVTIPDANFVTWLTTNYPSCMNGNMMDTTCSDIISATYLDFSWQSPVPINDCIQDLTGIRYFDNLSYLSCSYNQITTLPILPNSLQTLICSKNSLMSLPVLPIALQHLNCSKQYLNSPGPNSGYSLISLPSLPNSLKYLDCSWNPNLDSLPVLPNTLLHLNCRWNGLSSLPLLPNNLQFLDCGENFIDSLNALPDSLHTLQCDDNQLTNIPLLPNTLQTFGCSENQLTSLPTLPNSLLELYCFNNYGLINFPVLPSSLQNFGCGNSLYGIGIPQYYPNLPVLPISLHKLNILGSNLISLPTLPSTLQELICYRNQLSSLPTLPNTLTYLDCSNNQITVLPVLPNSLISLRCNNNQITSIPGVPNSMGEFYIHNNNVHCIENLPSVPYASAGNISNNSFTCVPNQTNYSGNVIPLCIDNDPINNPYNCQSVANIVGNVYKDLNNNCTYNNTDLKTENIPVKLYDNQNNLLALSYTMNGVYSFTALQPDTFKVKINDVALPIDMACGQSNTKTLNLTATTQSLLNNNFPVACDSAFDMEVHSLTPLGWVFPGQVHRLKTNLANDVNWYNLNCTNTNYSGLVTITLTGPVTYVAPAVGALTPVVSGNIFTYNISNFNSIIPTSFGLQLLTDTTAQAGQQICVHVSISPNTPDADTTNNEYSFCYNIFNSYDPNMKEVYPVNVLPGYNDWFTYTIHFQNTGSAPAFNIRLRDTLDTQLDLNTFEFLGASHTASTSLNGRNLSVRFNNIMLPDSTSNYEGSMGYYQYRIKPKANMLAGTNIINTAYIYFDYNPAIVTNTTENHFDVLTSPNHSAPISQNPKGEGSVTFYPNPSKVNFSYTNLPKNSTITIYNVLGEVCLTHHASLPSGEVGGAFLPKGIYFAKVNGEFVVKLVKE